MEVKEVGTKIREIRKEKKLSQIQVAKDAKIAVNSLRLYESNKRQPRFEQLLNIANALGVDVNVFYDPFITQKIENTVDDTWKTVQQFYGIDENDQNVISLLEAYNQLNFDGQQEAARTVKIIAGNPIFQRTHTEEKPPEDQ